MQNAIEKAEKDDFSETRALLKLLENPYSDEPVEQIIGHLHEKKIKCKYFQIKSFF